MAKNSYTIGKYRVLGEIASGSAGRVYRGEDPTRHNAPIAIKLLHSSNLASMQERDKFVQEARILTMLRHPHILPVLDIGLEGELPYIVTEFAANGSLQDYLKRLSPRPLPTPEALRIIFQIGQALQYAHERNILHRDLKPSNILFNAQGDALLADFGVATILSNSMKQGTAIGTPYYMAPEQFRGNNSTEADQYALGCITYELVTGRRPFSAPDYFALGSKHMTETPMPPSQLNMLLPRSLEQVILKAMAKQRNERYSSVAAYITALGGPTQAATSGQHRASLSLPSLPSSPSAPSTFPAVPPPVARINPTMMPTAGQVHNAPAQTSPSPFSALPPLAQDDDEDEGDFTFRKPLYADSTGPHMLFVPPSAPAAPFMPPGQPPAMHVDVHAPGQPGQQAQPFSPTNTLPRMMDSAITGMPDMAVMPTMMPPGVPPPLQGTPVLPPSLFQEVVDDVRRTAWNQPGRPGLPSEGDEDDDNDDDSVLGQRAYTPAPVGYSGNPVTPPPVGPLPTPVSSIYFWRTRRTLLTAISILLVLLIIGGSSLFAVFKVFGKQQPAAQPTAKVTIIPVHSTQVGLYTIVAQRGKSAAPVPGQDVTARYAAARVIQTHTIAATGNGVVPATVASGTLTFYNDSTSPQSFAAGTVFTGADGVQIVNDTGGVIPAGNPKNPQLWGTIVVAAHAAKAGQAGNITRSDINVWKANGTVSAMVVQNSAAFNGGKDLVHYTFVQQSDLNSIVALFQSSLRKDAQAKVMMLAHANESPVDTAQCSEQFAYDHHVGDHATTLNATITARCQLELYNQQGAFALVQSMLAKKIAASGGTAGPVFTVTVLQSQVINSNGDVSLHMRVVNAQFSDAQLQAMVQQIAGKSGADAKARLRALTGVKQATITISGGDGQTLPANPARITVTMSGS